MAASQKQLEANRRNAKKSPGPGDTSKTRFNALRHGLCAREVLIPGESVAELATFAEGLWKELQPASALEELLADRIVSLAWRLRRAVMVEAGILASSERSNDRRVETLAADLGSAEEGERAVNLDLKSELAETYQFYNTAVHFANLARYERALEGGFYRALNALAAARGNGFVSQKGRREKPPSEGKR